MTNYEVIKAMTRDMIIELIIGRNGTLLDQICRWSCSRDSGDQYTCPFCEDTASISEEKCIECVKQWLDSDATERLAE